VKANRKPDPWLDPQITRVIYRIAAALVAAAILGAWWLLCKLILPLTQ
jgi:hypothetical protein